MASARLPTSLQSGEDYKWKDLSKHRVYDILAATNAMTWTGSSARHDTAANLPFACKATANDGVFVSVSSGLSSTVFIVTDSTAFTGRLHILDGSRINGAGTGSDTIANYDNESAKLYHNKHWLTFDFPTANTSSRVANAETWTSALRAEVYDWAWQELGGASQMMGTVAYAPTTGVFTFTVAAGSPTGRLHVWTY